MVGSKNRKNERADLGVGDKAAESNKTYLYPG